MVYTALKIIYKAFLLSVLDFVYFQLKWLHLPYVPK